MRRWRTGFQTQGDPIFSSARFATASCRFAGMRCSVISYLVHRQ